MPSYLITGVSRGLGWEFMKQLSEAPSNTVIGLVRNKAATDTRIASELPRKNIHIVQADIDKYEDLERAAAETAAITKGSLDYIVANAAYVPGLKTFEGIGTLSTRDPKEFERQMLQCFKTNTVSQVNLFNLFLPLILKGETKKVIVISSGMADEKVVRELDVEFTPAYSVSKAAMNMVIAKFSAQYRKDGVLFLACCPGMADTGHMVPETPEEGEVLMRMGAKFLQYAPHFKGANTPAGAAANVISVFEKASIENGDAGEFVSQFGNKQWL